MINEPERSSDPADQQQAHAADSPPPATPDPPSDPGAAGDHRRTEHGAEEQAAEEPQAAAAGAGNESEPEEQSAATPQEVPPAAEEARAEQPTAEETPDNETPGNETPDNQMPEDEGDEDVEPLELLEEEIEEDEKPPAQWYILKVQVNREDSIRAALDRRVKIAGLEEYFDQIVVPTEDVAEFTKSGKRRVVKKKLFPGYIMVHMVINDDTWFLVRETPGIGDFTGSAGKPTPMETSEVERILRAKEDTDEEETPIRTAIPFKIGDRVRVKEGNFQNFEGEVENLDEANGRVTVMINIFGRSTPVELEHWHVEPV